MISSNLFTKSPGNHWKRFKWLIAHPSKGNLFSTTQKVNHLTLAIGTEILGVDLRQLSDSVLQKDEL
jgi:hypothetical protein